MSGHRKEIGEPPLYITCDPLARIFPSGWKDVWFRRQAVLDEHGVAHYTCPLCNRRFDHRMINYLQGDHVWPYSLFGETAWSNYQLICGNCNAAKSNRLDRDIRKVLGNGAFRQIVSEFLRKHVDDGTLVKDAVLESILKSIKSSREN